MQRQQIHNSAILNIKFMKSSTIKAAKLAKMIKDINIHIWIKILDFF